MWISQINEENSLKRKLHILETRSKTSGKFDNLFLRFKPEQRDQFLRL